MAILTYPSSFALVLDGFLCVLFRRLNIVDRFLNVVFNAVNHLALRTQTTINQLVMLRCHLSNSIQLRHDYYKKKSRLSIRFRFFFKTDHNSRSTGLGSEALLLPKPQSPRLNRRGAPIAVLHWPVDAVTTASPPAPHSPHPQHTGAGGGASHGIWSCWWCMIGAWHTPEDMSYIG